jgi:hypothetical protein
MGCHHWDRIWLVAVDEGGPQFRLLCCIIAGLEEERSTTQLVHPVFKVKAAKYARGEILTL